MHPNKIIQHLREAKGTKAMTAIIEQHADNEFLRECVALTYNQLISYNLSKIEDLPPPNPIDLLFGDTEETRESTMSDAIEKLMYLDTKGSASNADKLHLAQIKSGLPEDDAAMLDMIVARDFKCGATINTFRKVYGVDFVPDFPCMLCSPYNAAAINKNIDWSNAYSQLKSDGARCLIKCYTEGIELRSRNGKSYHGLQSLANAARKYTESCGDVVLDGELVVIDANGIIAARQTGNGVINKASSGTIGSEEADRVILVVWDIIDRAEFEKREGITKKTYSERWEELRCLDGRIGEDDDDMFDASGHHKRIKLTECRKISSLAEAKIHYAEMLARKEEGTIVKDGNGYWEDCRSTSQYKFKEIHPAEFRIVGWYPGKKGSKYENCIGGFNIESECGMVASGIGSGLTDEMRGYKKVFIQDNADNMTQSSVEVDEKFNPNKYIGAIVEGEYNARTITEGSEKQSLFLARVVRIRFDKDKANTLEEMIAQEESSRELKEIMEM